MQLQSPEPDYLEENNINHLKNGQWDLQHHKQKEQPFREGHRKDQASSNNKQLFQRMRSMKTEQCSMQQTHTQNSPSKQDQQEQQYIQSTKSPQQKRFHATTYRSGLIKSIHYSNELILVYLMYKEQKLSLFLNKGISFENLLRRLYKEIYIYEKETYSISNAILKNLLHKITGFESIDNDLLYDYELKYKRGVLTKQKFFIPFKQENHKTPFKIYCKISGNQYGGNQFLARNYSDGEWVVVTTIKKSSLDQDKITLIKKALKNNTMGCSLLLKSCSSSFSQINWLQTKHYVLVVSEYFPETLEQNLIQNNSQFSEEKSIEVFLYYAKWLAFVFKQMVLSNVQNFKKISLKNIGLSPSDGLPKISILDNVVNCVDFAQRRRSVIQNGKRVSQKIHDAYYYETYLTLITSLHGYLTTGQQSRHFVDDFTQYMKQRNTENGFSFETVFQYFSFNDLRVTLGSFQKHKERHLLSVDFTSKFTKIITSMQVTKNNTSLSNTQTLLISEVKQEVQRLFSMQNMRKNQQRNQAKSIIQMLSTTSNFGDLNKQNVGNVTEYKKEEQRKLNLKTKQRIYVQEILNELNHNENFIKITKENNLASIQFYLKKSDEKVKKKIVEKISTKYKKFFQKKDAHFQDNNLSGNMSHMSVNQELDFCANQLNFHQPQRQSQSGKPHFLPMSYKSPQNTSSNSKVVCFQKPTSPIVSTFIQKENFTTKILSRLQQRNTSSKLPYNSLKTKLSEPISPTLQKKRSKLQELFVQNKDYSKEEKLVLKKKQYGIYLEEAEKQYNKIRILKKNSAAALLAANANNK